jgi:hypothetical protein
LLEGIDENTNGVKLFVAVKGNGVAVIDMLTVGKYRVTQLDGWSWRYSPDSSALEINLSSASEILTFSQNLSTDLWLSGNGYSQFFIP